MFKFKHSNTIQSKDRLIWYTLRNDSGKILKVFLLSINKPLSYYQSRKLYVYIKNTAIRKLWSSWIWLRPFRQRSLALQGMKACSVQRRHVVWSTPGRREVPQCIWVSATADFELETLTSANCFGTLPFSLIGCAAVQCQFPSYLRLTSGGPASRGYRVKRQFLLNAHLLCYCKVWKAVSCRIRWSEQLTDLCSVSSLFIKKFGGGHLWLKRFYRQSCEIGPSTHISDLEYGCQCLFNNFFLL